MQSISCNGFNSSGSSTLSSGLGEAALQMESEISKMMIAVFRVKANNPDRPHHYKA